jgi:hypothetical protein
MLVEVDSFDNFKEYSKNYYKNQVNGAMVKNKHMRLDFILLIEFKKNILSDRASGSVKNAKSKVLLCNSIKQHAFIVNLLPIPILLSYWISQVLSTLLMSRKTFLS